jgi:hypothetical protein
LNALTLKSDDTINSNIKFETKPEYVWYTMSTKTQTRYDSTCTASQLF